MPYTLLLADDSPAIRRVIDLTFAEQDISVVSVGDGREALAALDRTPPDIVMVDAGMPGVSGYEVARHIRGTPHLAHIPVLLLTGAFEPVDLEQAAAVGCSGVLTKPFEPQAVVARVRELLSTSGRKAASTGDGFSSLAGEHVSGPVAPLPQPPSSSSAAETLDDYFDRVDRALAAFSNPPLSGLGAPRVAELAPAEIEPLESVSRPFLAVSPEPESAPAAGPPPVPLGEAFAALLAAEQEIAAPQNASLAGSTVNREALADDVARLVLERLSEGVLRDRVAAIVSAVAERVVREEIDRVMKSIPRDHDQGR